MTTEYRTLEDLREAGMAALVKELGPIDAVRFLRIFRPGKGDYTAERDQILGDPSLEELFAQLDALRADHDKSDEAAKD